MCSFRLFYIILNFPKNQLGSRIKTSQRLRITCSIIIQAFGPAKLLRWLISSNPSKLNHQIMFKLTLKGSRCRTGTAQNLGMMQGSPSATATIQNWKTMKKKKKQILKELISFFSSCLAQLQSYWCRDSPGWPAACGEAFSIYLKKRTKCNGFPLHNYQHCAPSSSWC